jgi:hypothetical protein
MVYATRAGLSHHPNGVSPKWGIQTSESPRVLCTEGDSVRLLGGGKTRAPSSQGTTPPRSNTAIQQFGLRMKAAARTPVMLVSGIAIWS